MKFLLGWNAENASFSSNFDCEVSYKSLFDGESDPALIDTCPVVQLAA